jgi:hypothetical protein
MKHITTELRESQAMAARKAVYIAGGDSIVITPLSYRICGVDMLDIYSEKIIASESDRYAQIDVTTDNSRSGSIVSAIRRITHAGSIVLASLHNKLPKRAV